MSPLEDRTTPAPRGLAELHDFVEARGRRGKAATVAFVGAGGKTSALFALARSCAASGMRVLVTTTTKIRDPEAGSEREGRGFGPVLLLPDPATPAALAALAAAGPRVVLAASRLPLEGKLAGLAPSALRGIESPYDVLLVEADGALGLSIKAPFPAEPVLPPG
jgi:probable selenium-dependent hydroxylase accessory protein YqeC